MMELTDTQIWIITGVVMFILEIITPGFVLANVGVGAFGAAVAAWLGADFSLQLIVFTITCIVSFFTVRPLLQRTVFKEQEAPKTGVAAIIGRTAEVTEEVRGAPHSGRVKIDGDSWMAVSALNDTIPVGSIVRIDKADSNMLTVSQHS